MRYSIRMAIVLTSLALVGFLGRPALGDLVSPLDPIFPSRNTYLVMKIDQEGKILSLKKIESNGIVLLPDRALYNFKSTFCGKNHFEYVNDYRSFREGLIAVRLNNKWGYVNKACKIIIPPQFDHADNFSNGLAAVEINKKWGYINKSGQIVIAPQYTYVWPFENGVATVHKQIPTPPIRPVPLAFIIMGIVIWAAIAIIKSRRK